MYASSFLPAAIRRSFGSLLGLLALALTPVGASAQTYYVSPVGSATSSGVSSAPCSLERVKALIAANNSNMNQDMVISLAGGTYDLSDTGFTLNESHSGSNGYSVIFKPATTADVPVFSGSQEVSDVGWTSVGNGIFKKNVGILRFRQLYVNGQRAVRARTPNKVDDINLSNYATVTSRDTTNNTLFIEASLIQNWARFSKVEMVMLDYWYTYRVHPKSFATNAGMAAVSFIDPDSYLLFHHIKAKSWYSPMPFYFENALEFLDLDNEWYLDETNGDLYYKPAGGSMSGNAMSLPKRGTLVNLAGTAAAPIHHVRFEGITFQNTTWTLPSNYPLLATQGVQFLYHGPGRTNIIPTTEPPYTGGMVMSYSHDVDVTGSTFTGMGYAGIVVAVGGQNLRLRQNTFTNMSATGIMIDALKTPNPTDDNVCKNILIAGNLFQNYGIDYQNGFGILSHFVRGMVIEHNYIRDGRYMGMQTGAQSGGDIDVGMRDNQTRYNRIENVMRLMVDGAAIYTLAMQRNSNVFENYTIGLNSNNSWMKAHDFAGSSVRALYFDNNSAYLTAERNKLDVGEIVFRQGSPGAQSHDITLINGGKTTDQGVANRAGLNNLTDLTTNLAAGQPTSSANRYSSITGPDKAVDGNPITIYSTVAGGALDSWWQVDLGQAYTLSRFEIVARNDLNQSAARQDYVIKGSNNVDGSNATVLAMSESAPWADRGTWIASCRSTQDFRYVRIEKTFMNFSEVRVFGRLALSTADAVPNLALGKPSTALSTAGTGYEADKGNDDLTSSVYAAASSSGTILPWWQIDLGAAYNLTRAVVVPRFDVNQPNERRYFQVQASNSSTFSTFVTLAGQSSTDYGSSSLWDHILTPPAAYRYVRIIKSVTGPLVFAELRLFGSLSVALGTTPAAREIILSPDYLYPNPAMGQQAITLELSGHEKALEAGQATVLDSQGRQLRTYSLRPDEPVQVQVRDLAPGVYLLRYTSVHTIIVKRFVVGQ